MVFRLMVLSVTAALMLNASVPGKVWDIKDEYVKRFSSGVSRTESAVFWDSLVLEFQQGDIVDIRGLGFRDESNNKYDPPRVEFEDLIDGGTKTKAAFDFTNSSDSLVIYGDQTPAAFGGGSQGHRVVGPIATYGEGLKNSMVLFPGKVSLGGGGYDNAVIVDAGGFGGEQFVIKDFKNSKMIYWDCNSNYQKNLKQVRLFGDFSNSVLVNSVQTNYCNEETSCILEGVTGATLLGGDNERGASTQWKLTNCEDVRMIGLRGFTSGGAAGQPICGSINLNPIFVVDGGKNNKFVFTQDIMDAPTSLFVKNSPNFMHWGGSWSHNVIVDQNSKSSSLWCFFTPEVFGATPLGLFGEPVSVDKEVVLTYKEEDLTQGDSKRIQVPVPPSIPTVRTDWDMSFPKPYDEETYGKALLDAGADPTGQELSDDAFAAVLQASEKNLVVPVGTFKISSSLRVKSMRGYSRDKTTIIMTDDNLPVLERIGQGAISDMTLEGGKYGIQTFEYHPGTRSYNLRLKDQKIAGIKAGTEAFYTAGGGEFDQQRFYNIEFLSTGDYGIQVNNNMVDKNQFYKCTFIGQNVAGISYPVTHMFAGAITDCYFERIDGPAIDFFARQGDQPSSGYTPHCSSIEGCVIIECGNAEEPAIDWNWMESASVSNTLIRIRNKAWKFGFRGTGQYMYNVEIDVDESKMVEGGAALALRHTRQAKNARPTGNILKKVYSTGPFTLINDISDPLKLDNPSFLGDWAYPHLLYDCRFSNRDNSLESSTPMVLLKADVDANIVEEVPLDPMEDADPPVSVKGALNNSRNVVEPVRAGRSLMYDMRGRLIETNSSVMQRRSPDKLSNGVYLMRRNGRTKVKPYMKR